MSTVREMITKWGFQVEESPLKRVEERLDGIKRAVEFLAITEIAKGIYEMGERFAKFAEELHIASTAAGLTAEEFQKLAGAAKLSGVSQEEMSGALAKLARNLYNARHGSEQALLAFQYAHISGEQIRSFRTTSDAMMALADSVRATADPIEKQAMLVSLMGRGSHQMVEMLSRGSDGLREQADEMGKLGILSNKQVDSLVQLEHAFQKVWTIVKYISSSFAANLAPAMKYVIDQAVKLYLANKKWIDIDIRGWAIKTAFIFGFMWGLVEDGIYVFEKIYEAITDFIESHKTLVKWMLYLAGVFASLLAISMIGKTAIDLFMTAMKPVETVWNLAKGIFGVVKSVLLWIITGPIGTAATWAFNAAIEVLSANVAFLELPVWAVVAAVAALAVVLQSAWAWLSGKKMEDTWLFKLGDMIKKIPGGISGFFGKVSGAFGGLEASLGAPAETGAGSGLGQLGINAPLNLTIEGNATDPEKLAKDIQSSYKKHLDEIQRQVSASLQGVEAY